MIPLLLTVAVVGIVVIVVVIVVVVVVVVFPVVIFSVIFKDFSGTLFDEGERERNMNMT